MEKQIDIHIFGMDDKLFQKLFPIKKNSIEEKDIGKIEIRKEIFEINKNDEDVNLFVPPIVEIFRKKYRIIWNAYKYLELTDNNAKKILTYFYKKNNRDENINSIVIKFNNSYMKDFSMVINKMQKNKPFVLNVLKDNEINENDFQLFKCPEYVSYIKDCNNYNEEIQFIRFIKTINSYIIDKQIYFFELNSTFDYLFNPKCFVECNILLIGESRAGKSCFINRVFNKLVSHEDANLESITNSSTQYTFKKGNVGIKFIDTPGIMNNSIIKLIKQIIDQYFGKIHLIYFFIKSQSNLENCIEILKYIKLKNEKNVKEGNKKIPLLFIKNGENLKITNEIPPFFKYLKTLLNVNKLLELYDDKFNQKENKEINEDELFNENEDDNNYDYYSEGNIVQIHIPTGKNIDKIFKLSKEYLIQNNKYLIEEENNELIQMRQYTQKLIEFFIKEEIENKTLDNSEKKGKEKLLEITNAFISIKKLDSSILNNLEILNIKKGNNFKMALGTLSGIISFPLLFASAFLPTIVCFGWFKFIFLFFDEYILDLSIQYGFDENDLIKYDIKKYLSKENNEDNEDSKKLIINRKKFLEKLLFYIGPIQCLIKAKELSKELFDLFEELKNKKEKEWITYKIHEFK